MNHVYLVEIYICIVMPFMLTPLYPDRHLGTQQLLLVYIYIYIHMHYIMGKSCCAPRCRPVYKGVVMKGITRHKFREQWKGKKKYQAVASGISLITLRWPICANVIGSKQFETIKFDNWR